VRREIRSPLASTLLAERVDKTMAGKCVVCGDRYQTDDEYRIHGFQNHRPDDFERKGENASANKIAIGSILAALVVGGFTGYYAHRANNYATQANEFTQAANQLAEEAVSYAESSDKWLNWEQTHQYANKVYLGEAPQYFYDAFRNHPNAVEAAPVTWVVLNASGVELHDVWIEGEGDRWIKIDRIQRCTMYSAPHVMDDGTEFVPAAVHFTDPISINGGYVWRRATTGALEGTGTSIATKEETDPADDGDSHFVLDVTDCSG
jgi:hypothetical protein